MPLSLPGVRADAGPRTGPGTGPGAGPVTGPGTAEHPAFLREQLITCLGNKRALLGPIAAAVDLVRERLDRDKLRILDAFSGSGVVSRLFKASASHLVSNDVESYARLVAECFLTNSNEVQWTALERVVKEINAEVEGAASTEGFIERLYAPRDPDNITADDRAFYTKENARRLDAFRHLIGQAPAQLRPLLLGPLLSQASVHANTAGVFKGFYKDRATKTGRFGGTRRDALGRICKNITLEAPVLSRFECTREVLQQDANVLAGKIGGFDLAYLDPPYNQHPYGANYFMLNLLTDYQEPARVSRVSGIPVEWNRSAYNVRGRALPALGELLGALDAKFVLVSYNDEGFIRPPEMRELLARLGTVHEVTTRYNTFRGSRNLAARALHVTEHLFLLDKRA